jgi:hypothetical protein
LLYADAGLGDTLQFVRYLPMVVEKGAIVLQVQPQLVPLLQASTDVTVLARGEALPPFDLHLPMIGLARGPRSRPFLLPSLIFIRIAKNFRNGAVRSATRPPSRSAWSGAGNPRHRGDRLRSLAAAKLLHRLVMPGVTLYSLEKDLRPADAPDVAALGPDIVDLAPALLDFSDTAAAVAALDLVITVDTSVAHLAGALGGPAWVLLPHALDWRWLRDREDTPWYPGMRLFRQRAPRAWGDVIMRVSAELARVVRGERDLLWPPGRTESSKLAQRG